MLTTIHLGPLALPTYPLLALLGFYLGLWLAARTAARRHINPDHIYNLGFYAVIGAALSGRLGHILFFFSAYRSDPLSILSPNLAAFHPWFALGAALLIIILYQRRHAIPAATLFDVLAYGALLTLAVLALADGLNGKHFGSVTSLPWAIRQWSEQRHPVQYYELAGSVLLLLLLWWRGQEWRPGQLGSWTIAGYAALRLFVDAFRGQPATLGEGFRLSQIVAFSVLILALLALYQGQTEDAGGGSVSLDWRQSGERG